MIKAQNRCSNMAPPARVSVGKSFWWQFLASGVAPCGRLARSGSGDNATVCQARTQLNFEPPLAALVANLLRKICTCASRASLSRRSLLLRLQPNKRKTKSRPRMRSAFCWLPRTRLRVSGHRTQRNFEPPLASLVTNFASKILPCSRFA